MFVRHWDQYWSEQESLSCYAEWLHDNKWRWISVEDRLVHENLYHWHYNTLCISGGDLGQEDKARLLVYVVCETLCILLRCNQYILLVGKPIFLHPWAKAQRSSASFPLQDPTSRKSPIFRSSLEKFIKHTTPLMLQFYSWFRSYLLAHDALYKPSCCQCLY